MQNVNLSLELPSHASEASGSSAPTSIALRTGSGHLGDTAWVLTFHGLLGNMWQEDLRNWEEQQEQKMDKKQRKSYCETTEAPARYDGSVFPTVDTIPCMWLLSCRWYLHQAPPL